MIRELRLAGSIPARLFFTKIALVLFDIKQRRIEPKQKYGQEYTVGFGFDEYNKTLDVYEDCYCWVVYRTFLYEQVRSFYKIIPIQFIDSLDMDKIVDVLDMQTWSCL